MIVDGFQATSSLYDNSHSSLAHNWSPGKKLYVVSTGLFINFNTCLSAALPTGALETLTVAFNVTSQEQKALPVAVFLIGYIFGPLIFGPMGESYGRKICFLFSFGLYTIFTLACAVAPNWPLFLLFRFLVGVGASAPQYILGGMYSDIYPNLLHRGKAMMMAGLMNSFGPLIGPIIAGYTSTTNWHWMFWIALILATSNWPLLLFLPENFAPVIIHRLQKTQEHRLVHPTAGKNMKDLVTIAFTRPIKMFAEPLVLFSDLFLVYQYSIYYLYFEAYQIIFQGPYGMTLGQVALLLLPIGVGGIIAMFIFLWYDHFLSQSKLSGKEWAMREEYRRLPLACVGGPLYAISLFWLGWTARPSIHWSVPALSGIVFGIGIDLTFMALNNYITDAYDIYSASALASSVLSRNIAAALLVPLATYQMYDALGVAWACSLLGFVCLALSPIPFVFIKYGPVLRKRSKFCQAIERRESLTCRYTTQPPTSSQPTSAQPSFSLTQTIFILARESRERNEELEEQFKRYQSNEEHWK
ncbi:hypothetical protein EAE99_005841 [Botrytis elliptica]|nr:hypothetical protein EAE99_005841 [Botrytis elliptica]